MSQPGYGEPDGFGRFAMLDTDNEGRLICHECGQGFHQLATHTHGAHGLTGRVYRTRHGLTSGTRLVSASTRAALAQAYDRHRDLHLEALANTRNPDAAQRASRTPSRWAPELVARRMQQAAERRVDLTEAQSAELGGVTDIRSWAQRARKLIDRDGVPVMAVARASDLSPATVTQRLRRHAPPRVANSEGE